MENGRLALSPSRFLHWKEHFSKIPLSDKKEIATHLVALTMKIIENVGEEQAHNEPMVQNTIQIIASMIRRGVREEKLLEALGEGIVEAGDSNVVVRDGKIIDKNVDKSEYSDIPTISSEHAFNRMGQRVRFNLDEKKNALNQARVESRQFFSLTLLSSIVGFFIIVVGVLLIYFRHINAGTVTSVVGIVSEGLAAIFFKKDKELREVVQSHLNMIEESQLLLTLIDIAETITDKTVRDATKRDVIKSMIVTISSNPT